MSSSNLMMFAMSRTIYRNHLNGVLVTLTMMKRHLGVRVKTNHKLVGFITGIPANIQVHEGTIGMAEINFLCVHKKLRSKRLAPVLIKEITRRVNKENIW